MSTLLENYNKFGVPLHSNMDEKEMSESWTSVNPEIRKNYSTKTNSIKALVVKKRLQDGLAETYATNKKNFDRMKEAIDASSAITQQQYQYPTLKGLEMASKEFLNEAGAVLTSLKSSIF